MIRLCPNCGTRGPSIFHRVDSVPIHDARLVLSREEALNYPRGDIALAFCRECGFVSNLAFAACNIDYSIGYEAAPTFSGTYNEYHEQLAKYLIAKYDLHHKDIVEIGCGPGEFLSLLCALGDNRGTGFDPAHVSGRLPDDVQDRLTFILDVYSEAYINHPIDFLCCKMTLEHIQYTADFLAMVRRSLSDSEGAVVFFQVPADIDRILQTLEFWHIYYEHPSYFSACSLARVFRRCGFEVLDIHQEFGNQYLNIEARPSGCAVSKPLPWEKGIDILQAGVAAFPGRYEEQTRIWRDQLKSLTAGNSKVVVWGAGAKAVSFLTTLGVGDEIDYAVDINPHKQGGFIPGSGQQIVAPDFLREYQPDVVVVVNPIYLDEIKRELERLGVAARLATV